MTLDEKREIIENSFKLTFDKGMAYDKVDLTEYEIQELDDDKDFQNTLQFHLIQVREKIVNNYRTYMDSEDEKIGMAATKDFAKLIYPEYFVEPKLIKKRLPDKTPSGKYDLSKHTDEQLVELAKQTKKGDNDQY